jgi:predicted DNA-binding transcriptional regulator YafY
VSFHKAEQLMELATMVAARHRGVTLDDVTDRFECSKRTAQRMLRTLERQFPDTTTADDEDGRRRWRLPSGALRELLSLTPEELAALDIAIEALRRSGLQVEADELSVLREKILALVPRSKVARLETDHEVLLEAQGLAARPGPRQRIDRKIAGVVAEAIKATRMLDIGYRSRGDAEARQRRVAPYGLLTGLRRYLVAKPEEDLHGPPRLYVFENIQSATLTAAFFEKDPQFNLQTFAHRAFGVFQNNDEFDDVVWRFTPQASERARTFEFHPSQTFEELPDGALIVRFRAAGHLEMAWHIYMWGDHIEVLAPARLREMVGPFRRGDFLSLP